MEISCFYCKISIVKVLLNKKERDYGKTFTITNRKIKVSA